MRKPYLIALDLDGTLLRSDKTIGERTKRALDKCVSLGHQLVIATGRPYRASQNYYTELGLSTPIVNFNGAHVHHPRNQAFKAYHSSIPRETVCSILDICHDFQIKNVMTEVIERIFVETWDEELMASFDIERSDVVTGPIQDTLKEDATCVLLNTPREQIDQLIEALDSEHAEIIEQRAWGAPSEIIEIVRKGTNKWFGLEKVAEYLQIPPSRILAFGDEENDLEMLGEAGIGVAMGNARDTVKSVATYITKTNDEEGVAEFLEKHFIDANS
ncbi:Cof-type HAD-IIB family hydrolase [Pullulanibacillus sp. KACC 23026]|uniref:Cof-type HAD-IIB family hydrolase n=1 Tax=Pullulanibacillus sp. KACC 23026 TaxID=3028315 RepID=UPI0023B0F383|nr:Cof-type HAD-IIB family hydrolase [Pullulanibacillus sp. KACC 23026]WEG11944.1 Cof-type HAD-IIB family hydrolase [Pullulanibacillus sp. KACC 23026]